MSHLDKILEHNAILSRPAGRGAIADFDEHEAHATERRLMSASPCGGTVSIAICPTMARNFESHAASRTSVAAR